MAPTKQSPPTARPPKAEGLASVIAWRRESLERAGFEAERAGRIAESDADLHRAVRLIEQGCDQELAEKILV